MTSGESHPMLIGGEGRPERTSPFPKRELRPPPRLHDLSLRASFPISTSSMHGVERVVVRYVVKRSIQLLRRIHASWRELQPFRQTTWLENSHLKTLPCPFIPSDSPRLENRTVTFLLAPITHKNMVSSLAFWYVVYTLACYKVQYSIFSSHNGSLLRMYLLVLVLTLIQLINVETNEYD
jgi:hypothetical protein